MALSFSPHIQLDRFSDQIHSHRLLPRERRTEVAAAFRKNTGKKRGAAKTAERPGLLGGAAP